MTCPAPPTPSTSVGEIILSAGSTTVDDKAITSGNNGITGGNATAVTTLTVTDSTIASFNYGIYLGNAVNLDVSNVVITATNGGNNYGMRLNCTGDIDIACTTITNSSTGTSKAVMRAYQFSGGTWSDLNLNTSGNSGEDSVILGGGASVIDSSQLEASNLLIARGVWDMGGSNLWIGARTHDVEIRDINFIDLGHITMYGADGSAPQDPACYNITFRNCYVDGDPLDFEEHFFHGTNVQNNAAALNIVIINATGGGLFLATSAVELGGITSSITASSSATPQVATFTSGTINSDNTLTLVWDLASNYWDGAVSSSADPLPLFSITVTRSGVSTLISTVDLDSLGYNGTALTAIFTLESQVLATDTSARVTAPASLFVDEFGNSTGVITAQSITNNATAGATAFPASIGVVLGGITSVLTDIATAGPYYVDETSIYAPGASVSEIFSAGPVVAEVLSL